MSTPSGPAADAPRWHAASAFFRARFGAPVRKVPLDAGFSCPNRDGTLSNAGCVFCNPAGSGTALAAAGLSLSAQWARLTPGLRKKHPKARLLAYLQSYSNTFAPLATLRSVFAEISALPGVAGLCLGTRPDCLDVGAGEARLDLLAGLAGPTGEKGLSYVQLDLGLQSADDAVLALAGRGHDAACFAAAARAAAARGLFVCAHLVHGLPGARANDLTASVEFLNALPVAAVKFHNLLVCRGAGLERLWRAGEFHPAGRDEYVAALAQALARLRPDICVQRLCADPAPGELVAPDWAADKTACLELLRRRLREQDLWQGKHGFCPDARPDAWPNVWPNVWPNACLDETAPINKEGA